MIVTPKIRGFICTTAHPVGCAINTEQQINYAKKHEINGTKRVLVIGSSGGYGLAARIVGAFSCGADTVGVSFDRPSSGSRTATSGWYNNMAFEKLATRSGRMALTINGDAFSDEVKNEAIEAIRKLPGGQVDLIIYSLASPKRTDPSSGNTYSSVLKPIGSEFSGKTVDVHTGAVTEAKISPANEEEIAHTVAVMGGQDWVLWAKALYKAGVIAQNAKTVAFSYIGPTVTHAIYKDGTIGKAKEDLERGADEITELLQPLGSKAYVAVCKALVTQASSAIPVVPLYISIIYKLMKENGTHEGCIEQMVRMMQRIYTDGDIPLDEKGRIRMDDLEMSDEIQQSLNTIWSDINSDNIMEKSDLEGYRKDFYRIFGFEVDDVDYSVDVEI